MLAFLARHWLALLIFFLLILAAFAAYTWNILGAIRNSQREAAETRERIMRGARRNDGRMALVRPD